MAQRTNSAVNSLPSVTNYSETSTFTEVRFCGIPWWSLLDFWNETNLDMFKKQRFALNDLLRV